MGDVIYEPTKEFPFAQITLSAPMPIAGGNHHIKYFMQGKSLYLQTPVCRIRGGLSLDLSGNKRPYCDLMFTNDNEDWIRWMEELETYTCKYIFEHRETWFSTPLEMADIENSFQSPLKIYKSGKFYLARTMIPVRLGKVTLKIYDDSEREVVPSMVTEETEVMTILQVHGIKCSTRSFQVELELKQMLVMAPTNVFEKCLLLGSNRLTKPTIPSDAAAESIDDEPTRNDEEDHHHEGEEEEVAIVLPRVEEAALAPSEEMLLQPVDISLDESGEPVEIKPRNEVFYEIYREARRKAKEARAVALAAYLEAKHIKNTYNLEDDDDSAEEGLDQK
jgi:hypothetical protein